MNFLAFPFLFSLCRCACAIKTNLFSWQPESFTHRRQHFFFALNGPRKIYSGKLIGFIFVCACCCLVRLTKSIMKFVIKFNDMIAVCCVFFSWVFFCSVTRCESRECRRVYFWGFVNLCDLTVRVIHNSHIFAVVVTKIIFTPFIFEHIFEEYENAETNEIPFLLFINAFFT